jgi:tripartite-type tricarboxylate transporter receptor subunit TctC
MAIVKNCPAVIPGRRHKRVHARLRRATAAGPESRYIGISCFSGFRARAHSASKTRVNALAGAPRNDASDFFSSLLTVLAALLLFSTNVAAQNFPSRPITLMVGLSPGGITDTVARTYGSTLAKKSGWTIIVENKTGAGGGVAAAYVQNAAPDGHTLLVFSGSQHATVAAVTPGMYQSVEGFSPISLLFDVATIIVVPARSPANSFEQLFELGRTKPGGLLMATQGVGSPPHILGSKLTAAAKVPMQPVHYRGGSALMTDLIEARVDFAFASLASGGAFVKDGKLKALAIDADARSRILPDVPTLAELGYGNQKIANWFGVAAPAGTPPQVIEALRDGFIKASQDEDLRQKLSELATPVVTSTPERMRRLMIEEKDAMEEFVRVFQIRN